MEGFQERMREIRDRMKDMKSERYAVANLELISLDDYVKALYLKVLCTVLQYENTPSEMQLLYLKRLLNGIGAEESADEYMRRALEIEDTDIREFLSIMKEGSAKYYFALEGLLLASIGNRARANYEYLAEILELMDIPKEDLEYICLVAKSVLLQQASFYDEAKALINKRVEVLDFTPYVRDYYVGAIVDSDAKKYYSAPDKKASAGMELPDTYEECDVTFENLAISMTKPWHWRFENCGEVAFRNCEIEGGNFAIQLNRVHSVVIENCVFKNFTERVLETDSVVELEITDSEFTKCSYCTNYNAGTVMRAKGIPFRSVVIQNNKFKKCFVWTKKKKDIKEMGFLAYFACDGRVQKAFLMHNEFSECRCINISASKIVMIGNLDTIELMEEGNSGMEEISRK